MNSTMESKRLQENISTLLESGSLKNVAVYGNTITSFATIQGLISQNVPAHIINLYLPASESSGDDMNAAPFADMFVKEQVYQNLGDLGVQVWKENVLEELMRDASGNLCGGVFVEGVMIDEKQGLTYWSVAVVRTLMLIYLQLQTKVG